VIPIETISDWHSRQIDATGAHIDHAVYELYDLTSDEIEMVKNERALRNDPLR
jgi:hypothetical protein